MEQGLNSLICRYFSLDKKDIRTYSPLTLAYIGDSIFDLIIRSVTVDNGNTNVNNLHRQSVNYVNARAQSKMIVSIMDILTEEEKSIFRRGKNTKFNTSAKNASISEYRNATGFEAVLGYLYLKDDIERILFLVKRAMETNERQK